MSVEMDREREPFIYIPAICSKKEKENGGCAVVIVVERIKYQKKYK